MSDGESKNSKNKSLGKAKERWELYQNQVREKIISVQELQKLRKRYQSKKIVFTIGAWDLLHEGHGRYLFNAKREGDVLVVGVASDRSRRRKKGEGHPVVGEKIRTEMLAYLASVDFVVIVEEDDLLPVLSELRPDIFYTLKIDWEKGNRNPEEEYVVQSSGGRVVRAGKVEPYISSSDMIEKVASIKIRQIVFSSLGKSIGNLILAKNGNSKRPKGRRSHQSPTR